MLTTYILYGSSYPYYGSPYAYYGGSYPYYGGYYPYYGFAGGSLIRQGGYYGKHCGHCHGGGNRGGR